MTREEFLRALEEKRCKEAELTSALAAASDAQMEPLLRQYLCCKYFLRPEELTTDNLIALGEKSTAKVAGLQRSGLDFPEKSAGCTTASSGVIKKTLLALALGRILGLTLDPDEAAEADTIGDLADLAVKTRKKARTC